MFKERRFLASSNKRRFKPGFLRSGQAYHRSNFGCFAPAPPDSESMSDHVYKKIELVGSSPDGFDAAVKNALTRASKTVRNMRWFEVIETRGQIENGEVNHWQVTLKVGFTLEP